MHRPVFRSASLTALAGGAALGAACPALASVLGLLDVVGIARLDYAITAGIVVGMLAALLRWEFVLAAVDVAMIFAILYLSNTPTIGNAARRWVRDDGPITHRLDAVIVLSAYVKSDFSLDPIATARLITGVELMKAGAAGRIVTSRVRGDFGGLTVTSDPGARELIHLADLDSVWSVVDSVHSTRDEAVAMARLLLPAGAWSVAVVTSPMHTRRACATFEAVGFAVHCVASLDAEFVTRNPRNTSDRLAAFRDYIYERLGMIKYRMKGWLPPEHAPAAAGVTAALGPSSP